MISTRHPFMAVTKPFGIDLNDPNLVLYLPLWSLKLSGSPFVSLDLNHHSFDVIGAIQSSEGRYFDAVDDKITHTASGWRSSDSSGTIIVWVKSTATAYLFTSSDEAVPTKHLAFAIHPDKGGYLIQVNGDTECQVVGNADIADNTWHMAAVTSSGTAWSIFHDNVQDTPEVLAGTNNGDWFADTSNRDNVVVGAIVKSSESHLEVNIGEVWVYSRALSAVEIRNIYYKTKGRYL